MAWRVRTATSTTTRASTSSRGPTRRCRGSTTSGPTKYFGLISNTAGGYSFYRDARLRRLTRYRYNNAPLDVGGRYLYVRDDDSGDVWSPSWQPVQADLEDYRCRHGLGYTVIGSSRGGIEVETLYFVPARRDARDLAGRGSTNRRAEAASLSLFIVRRVLPVGRLGRPDQLPAQPLHRRGRGRRQRDLPQDRVPRAPRPLRLLRVLRGDRRLRHAARRVPRAVPGLGTAGRGRDGASRPTRSRTAGRRSGRITWR